MYKCTGHGPEVASWEHRENNIYGSGYFATCDTCDKVFRSVQAADQHMDAVGHWAEDENMNAWGYPKCSVCNRQFTTLDGLCQHKNALGHWDATQLNKDRDFRCGVCSRVCATEIGLRQHKVALSHWDDKQGPNQSKTRNTLEESNDVEEVGTYKNLTCEVCGRECSTSAGLRQHKNAVNHWAEAKSCKVAHPHPSPSCPHCRESFAAASGVAEHIESGSCQVATGFDPEGLKKVIRQRDPHQVVTRNPVNRSNTPSATYYVSDRAYDAYLQGWCCYLCGDIFAAASDLHQHLNSKRHEQIVYHCPNRSCGIEFVRLAALLKHLESEACGYKRIGDVQHLTTAMLDLNPNRLITFA